MEERATESPFRQPSTVRLSFGTMLILLLMVVGAGVGVLLYFAFRVPAITTEINAWLGRPDTNVDRGDARRAQLVFALFVYTAPLALGILVYVAHFFVNWLSVATAPAVESDEFKME
jgi:sterol desaturase/sphingolipid hydroxylase (fatty acid hydroxylase superfamily)